MIELNTCHKTNTSKFLEKRKQNNNQIQRRVWGGFQMFQARCATAPLPFFPLFHCSISPIFKYFQFFEITSKVLKSHRVQYLVCSRCKNKCINVSQMNMTPREFGGYQRRGIEPCDGEYRGLCFRWEHMMLLMERQQEFAPGLPAMLGDFPDSPSMSVPILFQLANISSLIQT